MNPAVSRKVAFDSFTLQMVWTVWFLGIVLLIHLVRMFMALNNGDTMDNLFRSTHVATTIYMLVIGIISAVGVFPYFVRNGITRRDYFWGALMGLLGLAVAIGVICAVLTGLEYMVVGALSLPIDLVDVLDQIPDDNDDNIIATLVKTAIISPYIAITENWLLALLVFVWNALLYYLIGWLIGAGFYSRGFLAGMGCIALGLVALLIRDSLWGRLGEPFSRWFEVPSDPPLVVPVVGTLVLAGLIAGLIRLLTRRAVIKM